jgi:hypothetical protein
LLAAEILPAAAASARVVAEDVVVVPAVGVGVAGVAVPLASPTIFGYRPALSSHVFVKSQPTNVAWVCISAVVFPVPPALVPPYMSVFQ